MLGCIESEVNGLAKGAFSMVCRAVDQLGQDRVMVGPSCSLLHVPVDLGIENELDSELKGWLAFAKQKLEEIEVISSFSGSGACVGA
jgi:5-methyltetrahydropteroyltriglutamate--homocysteine methyltransferase